MRIHRTSSVIGAALVLGGALTGTVAALFALGGMLGAVAAGAVIVFRWIVS